ncbi:hypothetical protein [uncultured Mediterranean phage uvMED]|nr:hypothetical protein [uncultured Mediterranean phage uvMED]
MTRKISENGVIRNYTAEEEAQADERAIRVESEVENIKNNIQAKAELKASAKAKLIAGEPLTEDEANTIVLT